MYIIMCSAHFVYIFFIIILSGVWIFISLLYGLLQMTTLSLAKYFIVVHYDSVFFLLCSSS